MMAVHSCHLVTQIDRYGVWRLLPATKALLFRRLDGRTLPGMDDQPG